MDFEYGIHQGDKIALEIDPDIFERGTVAECYAELVACGLVYKKAETKSHKLCKIRITYSELGIVSVSSLILWHDGT
jgi:hypothetical protein